MKKQKQQLKQEKVTSVDPALDPKAIFERGFVTKEEASKVDLGKFSCKINIQDKGLDSEGIWVALITMEDGALYNSDVSHGAIIQCILLNDSLHFMPNRTWGRVIQAKTNGKNRPICERDEQLPLFMRTQNAYNAELGDKGS